MRCHFFGLRARWRRECIPSLAARHNGSPGGRAGYGVQRAALSRTEIATASCSPVASGISPDRCHVDAPTAPRTNGLRPQQTRTGGGNADRAAAGRVACAIGRRARRPPSQLSRRSTRRGIRSFRHGLSPPRQGRLRGRRDPKARLVLCAAPSPGQRARNARPRCAVGLATGPLRRLRAQRGRIAGSSATAFFYHELSRTLEKGPSPAAVDDFAKAESFVEVRLHCVHGILEFFAA